MRRGCRRGSLLEFLDDPPGLAGERGARGRTWPEAWAAADRTALHDGRLGGELPISVNTVKTRQRHLYQKPGALSRTQAVGQARALGLLPPSARATNAERQRCEYQL